jgi:hypothetical protein
MSSETAAPDSSDPAFEPVARELYWAERAVARARMSNAAAVRDGLHDFASLMRADERVFIPRGEPNLAARTKWKRRSKLRLFRLMRPISRRYDRLLAEHAELTTALAERVAILEAEVEALRERLEEREA